MSDQRFPRRYRVRLRYDYDRVYRCDAFAADDVLVLRGCANGLPYARLGLSVSRRVGNAVTRNRWKRLIREAFRKQREALPAGYDFVIRPRRGARPDFEAIMQSLPRMARKLAKKIEGGKR